MGFSHPSSNYFVLGLVQPKHCKNCICPSVSFLIARFQISNIIHDASIMMHFYLFRYIRSAVHPFKFFRTIQTHLKLLEPFLGPQLCQSTMVIGHFDSHPNLLDARRATLPLGVWVPNLIGIYEATLMRPEIIFVLFGSNQDNPAL